MTDCQLRRLTNVENAKPACNEDGSYQSFQCDQASLPHKRECWCVHQNGQMIKGNTVFTFEIQNRLRLHYRTIPMKSLLLKMIAQKMKDFFSKCQHARSFLQICSSLQNKPLMENFIF